MSVRELRQAGPAGIGSSRIRANGAGIAIAALLSLFILTPLVNVAIWAFTEVWRYPAVVPQKFGFRFWADVLSRGDVHLAMTTSLSLAAIVTALSALICLPASYAFARMDFPGRNLFFMSFLTVYAFPKFGLYITIATIFLGLGLIGNFWGVVLIQLVSTLMFMVWIPVSAFQNVDRRQEEAARDVGASQLRVFWSITLPQVLPAISAAVLLTFVNTFYETEVAWLIGAPEVRTVPLLMVRFINSELVVQYGAVLSLLLWVPSFVLLMLVRRFLGAQALGRALGA
jgi:putative spermidine/putrescine transport system permease protein